jgi:hypothetical protein
VVRHFRFLVAALAALAVSCRSGPPADSYVPADTRLVAGFDAVELRASPLRETFPPVALFLDTFREAAHLTVAFSGNDFLAIARGRFRTAPAGWTLVEPGVALSGPPQKRPSGGPPRFLSKAASVIAGKPIWIVAQGGITLPLTGNAANVNRLLRDSEFGAVTATLGSQMEIEFTAVGRTPEAGRDVEETLRAVLAMIGMAEKRGSDVAALLSSVEIHRQDRTVRATVSANAETVGKLLEPLTR